jgi:hypothetical protein
VSRDQKRLGHQIKPGASGLMKTLIFATGCCKAKQKTDLCTLNLEGFAKQELKQL